MNEIVLGDSQFIGTHPLLGDRKINCVIADPPYGVAFQSNFADTPEGKKKTRAIESDGDIDGAIDLFRSTMHSLEPRLADEVDVYVFTSWNVMSPWQKLLREFSYLHLKQCIVWAKGWPGLGDLTANWGCGHEFILYLKKGRRPVNYRRSAILHYDSPMDVEIDLVIEHLDRLQAVKDGAELMNAETGIISIDKPATMKHVHPTEKPVALIEQLIRMSTTEGDLVVDPFSGSGSTSVAAQNLGRDSFAMEIDPEYVKIGQARLDTVGLF